jgi:hypothetical protein
MDNTDTNKDSITNVINNNIIINDIINDIINNKIDNNSSDNDITDNIDNKFIENIKLNTTINKEDIVNDINKNKILVEFKNNIDLLTLEYFSKQKSYNRYFKNSETNNLNISSKNDKKFYKKRIINETKKMIKNEFENELLRDNFNKYISSLISYFKFKDKTDILQEEYKEEIKIDREIYRIPEKYDNDNDTGTDCDDDGDDEIDNIINCQDLKYNNSINDLFFNFNKKEFNKKVTLDNFVISNINNNINNENTKNNNLNSFPLQKKIDLREPSLKTKGIKSKNKEKEINTNIIE